MKKKPPKAEVVKRIVKAEASNLNAEHLSGIKHVKKVVDFTSIGDIRDKL